jgi:predicted transcriptional regulator
MTTTDPDQIRRQIEGTRRDLSADVNALTEKVSPGRVVGRRVERARSAVTNLKDKIMGTAQDMTYTAGDTASGAAGRVSSTASSAASTVADTASSAASSVADTVSSAPQTVRRQAQGNPLAAGLIAFGAGWLISSMLPSTRKEQELASQAKDVASERLQPVAQQLQQAATEVKDNLREPAQQAVESVKSTASDAASTVTEESRTAADHVSSRTQEAKANVRDQAGT